jgi:uncharacterized membrane protein YcaP (DUF421 family)
MPQREGRLNSTGAHGPDHPSPGPDTERLDVGQDIGFQRAEWRVQRWGIGGLGILIAASILGAVGSPTTFFRVLAIYVFLLVVFRLAGQRTLAQMNSFDLVLVLVIGDATQQALIGDDFTIGTAVVAISSLIVLDVVFGYVKCRWSVVDRAIDGLPLILVDRGIVLAERMAREGIDLSDILSAGRQQHGLRRLDQIDFAVLERSGGLSIIPRKEPD